MSFVISGKQHLAPTEARTQYEPLIFEEEGLEVERIDVGFGHPLYTAVADIFHIKSITEEVKMLPIIPDGCMSLVFRSNGEEVNGYICGAIDEIKKIKIYPKDHYIFIRFLPGMGYSFIKTEANKLTNKAVKLKGNAFGGEQLLSILERETQLAERIGFICKVIRVRMQEEPNKYLIKYCTDRIFQNQGNIKVDELAVETGFTARYIGKMFEKCVGIAPKLYSQIIRLQMSMERILDDKEKLLVDIAVDCGFFDHAHMNRAYKKLLKCSSGEFRKNMFEGLDYDKIDDYISTGELMKIKK